MTVRLPRGLAVPFLFTLTMFAVLCALGIWQLERRAWKEGLIDTIKSRLAAPSEGLPARETWPRLGAADTEFRRVAFSGELLNDREALVYTSGSALRPEIVGPGYWVFTPVRVPGGGLVVVNRGFVPEGKQSPTSRAEGQVREMNLVGAIRLPERPGLFTPNNSPAHNLFFVRDPAAIAAAKGWGAVAPFYVEQESPAPPGGLPRPGKIAPNLPNKHLQYAITWFALAGAVIVLFGLWVRAQVREKALI